MEDHEPRGGVRLRHLGDVAEGDALPARVELRPARDAVDVEGLLGDRQRSGTRPSVSVSGCSTSPQTRKSQPVRSGYVGHAAEVEHRELVGQHLAGRDALGELGRHVASLPREDHGAQHPTRRCAVKRGLDWPDGPALRLLRRAGGGGGRRRCDAQQARQARQPRRLPRASCRPPTSSRRRSSSPAGRSSTRPPSSGMGWVQQGAALAAAAATPRQDALRDAYLRHCDFGDAAADLARRPRLASRLTVREVADAFAGDRRGRLDRRARRAADRRSSGAPATEEARFIGRVVSRETRIGLREGLLEEAVAAAFDAELDDGAARAHADRRDRRGRAAGPRGSPGRGGAPRRAGRSVSCWPRRSPTPPRSCAGWATRPGSRTSTTASAPSCTSSPAGARGCSAATSTT